MEETVTKKRKINLKFVAVIAVCAGLVLAGTLSLFVRNFDSPTDDYLFHIDRILGVANALRGGQFPVKYYDTFFEHAGYFSPIFYGDLFVTLPALLVICGMNVVAAYYIFDFIILTATAVSMYFLLKLYIKNKYICVIGATYFVLSQYIFLCLFYRGAIGESLGILFMVWLFIAIHNMLHENFSKPWLFTIAFLGMLFSHMTSLIISAVVLIVVVLVNAKKLFPQKAFWLKALLAFGIFIGIGCYFICSFVEMYFSDKFMIAHPWTYVSLNTLTPLELFTSRYGTGVLILVPLVLRCFFLKKKDLDDETKAHLKTVDKLMIVALILTALTTDILPWKLFDKILIFLQFPWRVFSVTHILFAICFTIEIYLLYSSKKYKIFLNMFIVALSLFFVGYNNLFLFHYENFGFEVMYGNDYGVYEWFPERVLNIVEKSEDGGYIYHLTTSVLDENGKDVDFERKQYDTQVTFEADQNSATYTVPIFYYKGYEATITLSDGNSKNLEIYENENGYIAVKTENLAGTVVVRYKGTTVQKVSLAISILSVVGTCAFAITKTVLDKKKSKKLKEIETK